MRLSLILLLLCAVPTWADKYYCIVFSHDSHPIPLPHRSHVWGTFVRTDDYGKLKREFTISWAPRTEWHWTDRVKEGYNMTLRESLEDAVKCNRRICFWGPFEIEEDFYDKAVSQWASPGYYKCIDTFSRRWTKRRAENCIHRLSDIAGSRLITHVKYGRHAGHAVYVHFNKKGLLQGKNDQVMVLLSLNNYQLKGIR